MDTVKKLFNNTVIAALLAVIAIASIVWAVTVNIQSNNIGNNEQNGNPAETTSADELPSETLISGNDYRKAQEAELSTQLLELDSLSNPKSSITGIIDRYIELRYNYTDGPDKEYILNQLTNITRKSFLGKVDNSLNYQSGSSEARVVKRYENIQNTDVSGNIDTELCTLIYIIDINGENKVIEYTMIKESGVWVIYAEKGICSINSEEIQTHELLKPRDIYAVEPPEDTQRQEAGQ